jgi:anti-sigma factor RsiW
MTPAVDGELAPRHARALERHVADCTSCRGELALTRTLLGGVAGLPTQATVSTRLEQSTLRAMRLAAAEEEEQRARRWWRTPAFSVLAVAVVQPPTVVAQVPAEVHAVPSDPPPELAARPELFVDLPILRHMEKLEHLEAIRATAVDDNSTPGTEEGERSNG